MPIGQADVDQNPNVSKYDLIQDYLKAENWPTPQWYSEKQDTKRIQSYETYFALQLRARYVALEMDFRSVFGNYPKGADIVTSGRIVDLLHSSRALLEQEAPNLLTVSSALDLVDRYMVWLYPPWVARARISTVLLKLSGMSFKVKDLLVDKLTKLAEQQEESYNGQIRSVLDETIGIINDNVIEDHISRGLQLNRLRSLRRWGAVMLAAFLLVSPFAINIETVNSWPSQGIGVESHLPVAWANALAMAFMGAVGGFLSGLLQARNTRISLAEYLENNLKLQLKPLVGAIVALVLYVLLSWQVLPGIVIENAGSFFIIAFVSGFSERYFLRLLDLKDDMEVSSKATAGVVRDNNVL